MASLIDDQSKPSDHDRLGFHPDCSACRHDRIFGVFSPEPVFSYRLRVYLVTGVLALSVGATTTSVAAEPDSHQEGPSAPEEYGSPTLDNSTGEAPEQSNEGDAEDGDDTALPIEVDAVPIDHPDDGFIDAPEDGANVPAPLEAQPTPDSDGQLGLTDPGEINADEPPVSTTETAPPVAPSPPLPPPHDTTAPPDASDESTRPAPEDNERGAVREDKNGDGTVKHLSGHPGHNDATPVTPAPAPTPVEAPATPAESVPSVAAVAPPQGIARFHVVKPGESLWSIATELLRAEAPAGAIALEVHRLWGLNGDRIGTGDPDLLPVGVKLRLR
ncbi:MAG: hypothetical protein QOJ59_72 [Thermomicrobiales bacterium]|nr:hypothetical protein [Thermomicrobiales bacterium]